MKVQESGVRNQKMRRWEDEKIRGKAGFLNFSISQLLILLVLTFSLAGCAANKAFKEGETVSPKTLFGHGLIKSDKLTVKILGSGKLSKKLTFKKCQMSKKVKDLLSK